MPQLTDPERYEMADTRLASMLHDEKWGAWMRAMIAPGLFITVVLDTEPVFGALARARRHNGGHLPGLWAVDVPHKALPVLVELTPLSDEGFRAPVQARRWGDVASVLLRSSYTTVRDVIATLEERNGW